MIRIRSKKKERLIDLADHILRKWRAYSDEEAFIFAETKGQPHNTITPIVRKRGDVFEVDLTLRNNITTEEYPLGVYHPHQQWHNIKKENIGLIEVMGLAILPARLKTELEMIADCLVSRKELSGEALEKHRAWVESFRNHYDFTKENVMDILKQEVGKVFVHVLEDAGVYKCTTEGRLAFKRFLSCL